MTELFILHSCSFPTAPCLPDSMVADLDCNVNYFAVQWRGSIGDLDSYTAIAIGSDGTRATCDTTNTNCIIQSLKCGLSYNIVVTTSSVNCGTIEGSDYSMQSGNKFFFLNYTIVTKGTWSYCYMCKCPLVGVVVPRKGCRY